MLYKCSAKQNSDLIYMFQYVCQYFSVFWFAGMYVRYRYWHEQNTLISILNWYRIYCPTVYHIYTILPKCNVALASEIRLGDSWLRCVALISFASIYCRMKTRKQSRYLALLISDQPVTNKSTHRSSDYNSALGQYCILWPHRNTSV